MVKRIRTKSTTRVHETLHRNRKFEQHEIYYKSVVNSGTVLQEGKQFFSYTNNALCEKKTFKRWRRIFHQYPQNKQLSLISIIEQKKDRCDEHPGFG